MNINVILYYKLNICLNFINYLIGDWGLGIGPNPQSPIPNPLFSIL